MANKMKEVKVSGQTVKVVGHDTKHTWRDLYFYVLISPWWKILFWLASGYLITNLIFAFLYMAGGDCIKNATPGSFWDQFFFSVQTWATIGYGDMAPKTRFADVLVGIESFSGLISMSVITGLVFSKFAQPKAKVRFSKNLLITMFDGQPTLMFRLGNMRANQIVEARLMAVYTSESTTAEGVQFRKLQDLKLVRETTVLFSLSWTILHTIDDKSPFYGQTNESLADKNIQIVVSLTGHDAQFNQTVHARTSYGLDDIVWNRQFADILSRSADGQRIIDYSKFDVLN